MATHILGISAYYHDSAACLVTDGRVVAAAQEERFSRIKHDFSFPGSAAKFCLDYAGLTVDQLECLAFYDKPFLKFERILETYLAFAPAGIHSFLQSMPMWLKQKLFLGETIRRELGYEGRIIFTQHHESHAASAFYPSPYPEAAILTVDGVGEWATATIGVGKGNEIQLLSEIHFPHSLGLLYSANRNGRTMHKYTAVAPSASNVFIRSDDEIKDYSADPAATPIAENQPMALGPEDLQQIVDAIMQTDAMQWVQTQMQASAGTNATVPPVEGPPTAGQPPSPLAAPPPTPAPPPAAPPAPPPAGPPESAPPTNGPPSDGPPPEEDEEEYCDKRYEATEAPTGEYQTADQGNLGGRKVKHTVGTPVDQDNASTKNYEAGSSDPNLNQPADDASVEGDEPADVGSVQDGDPAASTYQTADQGNLGGRKVSNTTKAPPEQGNATTHSVNYQLLETKLAESERRVAKLEKYAADQEAKRISSERFAALQSKRQRFTFDLEKEVERCKYGKMNDAQFQEHLEGIESNYREIPVDEQLPIGWGDREAMSAPGRPGASTEKYSKEARDKALRWCIGRAQSGQPADYETALDSFGEHDRPPETT